MYEPYVRVLEKLVGSFRGIESWTKEGGGTGGVENVKNLRMGGRGENWGINTNGCKPYGEIQDLYRPVYCMRTAERLTEGKWSVNEQ